MDTEKIQALLAELHEELGSAEKLPNEIAEEARTVIADLTGAIPPPEERHGAVERLEEMATKFEAEHPTIASAARQIAVALGRMGI
jgi:hypothetical protein